MLTRGQSSAGLQQGALTRGNTFDSRQFADQAMGDMTESPRLEVLVTPAFTSQELNMLLEVVV